MTRQISHLTTNKDRIEKLTDKVCSLLAILDMAETHLKGDADNKEPCIFQAMYLVKEVLDGMGQECHDLIETLPEKATLEHSYLRACWIVQAILDFQTANDYDMEGGLDAAKGLLECLVGEIEKHESIMEEAA